MLGFWFSCDKSNLFFNGVEAVVNELLSFENKMGNGWALFVLFVAEAIGSGTNTCCALFFDVTLFEFDSVWPMVGQSDFWLLFL